MTKLQFDDIEIRSFRGIKQYTLNFDKKSLVFCGANGTGKSSFVNAIEYLFTGKVVEMSDSYSIESVAKVLDRMYPTDTPTRICMNLGDELFKGVHDRFPSVTMYYNTNSIISGMSNVIEEQCLNSVTNRKIGQLLSMPGSKLLNYQNRQLQSFFKKNPEIEKLYFLKESFDEAIENKEMLDDWFDQVQSSKFSKLQIDRGMLFNYPGMELSFPLNLPGHGYSFGTIRNLVIFRPN